MFSTAVMATVTTAELHPLLPSYNITMYSCPKLIWQVKDECISNKHQCGADNIPGNIKA